MGFITSIPQNNKVPPQNMTQHSTGINISERSVKSFSSYCPETIRRKKKIKLDKHKGISAKCLNDYHNLTISNNRIIFLQGQT